MANNTEKPNERPDPPLPAARGWGAWVVYEWHPDEPACVGCGQELWLDDGCEWHDYPELNLCHQCAVTVLESMRPNDKLSHGREHEKL